MSERVINVVVAMDFSDEIMERLRAVSPRLNIQRYEPGHVPNDVWATTEVLYTVRDFPEPTAVPNLRWVQLNYAGLDGVILKPIIQTPDIMVTTASGVHAETIANYCLMMMLAFHFQLPHMIYDQQKALWHERPHDIYRPTDMRGKTLGIVGYGTIARELARVADALGVRVLATKRDVKRPSESGDEFTGGAIGDPTGDIPHRLYPPEALPTMARECDWLVVTAPLTESTFHMVNAEVFDVMKPTSILINIARGAVVKEEALIEALREKKIGGAALDVFEVEPLPSDSPLWSMENVIISPHTAGNTVGYHEKAANIFIENLKRYVEKKSLVNTLNREWGY
jgi:phosphoglycerate dehydrogenase-like enzyme